MPDLKPDMLKIGSNVMKYTDIDIDMVDSI